jgi:signal transduction histidine kinase/Tfp pilus assembly protein PilF
MLIQPKIRLECNRIKIGKCAYIREVRSERISLSPIFSPKLRWLVFPLMWIPLVIVGAPTQEDSLLKVLRTLPQDTQRVLTLNELFKTTLNSEPLKALDYGQQALKLARSIDYKRGVARLSNNLGVWHSKRGNYQESLFFYTQCYAMQVELSDSEGIANCEINTGSVFYKMGDYPRALEYYGRALDSYRSLEDTVHLLDAVNNMGSVYMEQGKYPEALQAFMAAMRLREILGSPSEIAISCMNVGSIYQLEGMLDLAIGFFQRSLELYTKADDQFGRIAALSSIAEINMVQHHPEKARPLLLVAQTLATKIEDQFGLATVKLGLANLHEMKDNPDSAAIYFHEALAICRKIGRTQGIADALNHLGHLEVLRKNWTAAEKYFLESLQLSDSLDSRDLSRDNHLGLSQLYASKGTYSAAYAHQIQYTALHESIYSNVKAKQIAEMQAQYEAKSKQDEINRLNLQATQDQLRIAKAYRRSLLLLAILLPMALLAFIFIMRNVQKQRLQRRIEEKNAEINKQRDLTEAQNKQILEINASLEKIVESRTQAMRNANQELDTFLYQSAHALRRPLVRIEGLLQVIDDEPDEKEREKLQEKLGKTIREMDALLHQLIYASESGHRDPQIEPIPLNQLVMEVVSTLPDKAKLVCSIPQDFCIHSDRYLFTALLSVILENAFRFQDKSKAEPMVKVELHANDDFVTLQIEDNGIGIASDQLHKVCEMFYKGSQRQGGNGLGLYLAQKITQRLQGTLTIESVFAEGTTVTIAFPMHVLGPHVEPRDS